MNARARQIFLGVFLIIVPPVLVLASGALSVAEGDAVRRSGESANPLWDVLFPIGLIASFLCIPLGAYVIYRAIAPK
jgi:hypothetical protein